MFQAFHILSKWVVVDGGRVGRWNLGVKKSKL